MSRYVAGTVVAIFRLSTGEHVTDVPYADDGNHGLPDWYFGYDAATDSYKPGAPEYDSIMVHPSGSAEWVPGMGPAPCWFSASGGLLPRAEMYRQLEQWARAVYGGDGDPPPCHNPPELPWVGYVPRPGEEC